MKMIDVILEKYVEDPYMIDNDIYYHKPSFDEISRFDVADRPSYRPAKKIAKKEPVKPKRVPSGKKYTGMAKIVYTHRTGIQEDISNSFGPVAIVKTKLKNIIRFMDPEDAKCYSIKYETL